MFENVPADIIRVALEEINRIISDNEKPAYKKLSNIERIVRIINEYRDIYTETDSKLR